MELYSPSWAFRLFPFSSLLPSEGVGDAREPPGPLWVSYVWASAFLTLASASRERWAHWPRMSLKLQSPGWWGWGDGGGRSKHFSQGPSKALFLRAATDALEPLPPPRPALHSQLFLLVQKKGVGVMREKGRERRKKIERNNPTTKSVPLQ